MSHARLVLRPLVCSVAVAVLASLAGCGLSSSREAAKPPVPAAAEPQAEGALSKQVAMPVLMAAPMAMRDAVAYRAEPQERYQDLPDNPVYSVAQTPV